jgi:Membrane-associated lipoprotein involved in thiamine biosynthesis
MLKTLKKATVFVLCLQLMLLTACKETPPESSSAVQDDVRYETSSYAMDTVITQILYGPNAEKAASEVNVALLNIDAQLSRFVEGSYITQINANAGIKFVQVPQELYDLLKQETEWQPLSNGAFYLTIGPITQAWGVTTDTPRVVPQSEIDTLLPLVNDADILFDEENCAVMLRYEGQALDLGAIAKGWACNIVKDIYEENGITRAVISLGGNVYAMGVKPDGTQFRVGFRDPEGAQNAFIARFTMQDKVISVSGGYERYFEADGVIYNHIMNPATGAPVITDVTSVGVIHEDGSYAEFMSTTLYVWGIEKTVEYMSGTPDCEIILLDAENHVVYVSNTLEGNFALYDGYEEVYEVVFI